MVTHLQAVYQHYLADLAWHEFIGPEPTAGEVLAFGDRRVAYSEAVEDFEAIRRVQSQALGAIEPGMDHQSAQEAVNEWLRTDAEASRHINGYFIHGVGLEVHEEPVLGGSRPRAVPLDGPIHFRPGAVVSSEWFTGIWTVEEPFVMTPDGWEPMVELRGITAP